MALGLGERRALDADHEIALRPRLAGERVAPRRFLGRERHRKLRVRDAAPGELHAAGAAAAERALVRELDSSAHRCREHGFVRRDLERLRRLDDLDAMRHVRRYFLMSAWTRTS